jgi:hypothetical protein
MNHIAAVLYIAANEYLSEDQGTTLPVWSWHTYQSCTAARIAARKEKQSSSEITEFLVGLGVKDDFGQFDEFKMGVERQQARYTWLMFAAMIAVEEFPHDPEYDDDRDGCTEWDRAFVEVFGVGWLVGQLEQMLSKACQAWGVCVDVHRNSSTAPETTT